MPLLKRGGHGTPATLRTAESLSILGGQPEFAVLECRLRCDERGRGHSPVGDTPDDDGLRRGCGASTVHFAAGAGICLAAERGMLTRYSAQTFGADFHVAAHDPPPLSSVPSRARVVSRRPARRRDGVVSGDSYSSTSFSTRTSLIDMSTGKPIRISAVRRVRDGATFKAIDFNFWASRSPGTATIFSQTLQDRRHRLPGIEGNVNARTARVLREGVECPSAFTPDISADRVSEPASVPVSSHICIFLGVASLKGMRRSPRPGASTTSRSGSSSRSVAYMLPADPNRPAAAATSGCGHRPRPRLLALLLRQAYSPVALAHPSHPIRDSQSRGWHDPARRLSGRTSLVRAQKTKVGGATDIKLRLRLGRERRATEDSLSGW